MTRQLFLKRATRAAIAVTALAGLLLVVTASASADNGNAPPALSFFSGGAGGDPRVGPV